MKFSGTANFAQRERDLIFFVAEVWNIYAVSCYLCLKDGYIVTRYIFMCSRRQLINCR